MMNEILLEIKGIFAIKKTISAEMKINTATI